MVFGLFPLYSFYSFFYKCWANHTYWQNTAKYGKIRRTLVFSECQKFPTSLSQVQESIYKRPETYLHSWSAIACHTKSSWFTSHLWFLSEDTSTTHLMTPAWGLLKWKMASTNNYKDKIYQVTANWMKRLTTADVTKKSEPWGNCG